jgi:hypothetical protein
VTDNTLFISPFKLCQQNPSVLIAGSRSLWRTVDATASWSPFGPSPLVAQGVYLSALAFAGSDPTCQTFFAGSTSGTVFRNTTSVANVVSISSGLPGRGIQDIAVDPTNANVVFVGLAGYGPNVWKTTNALAASPTWSNVSVGLPSVPVNAVLLDPMDHNYVYVGTDTGIFRSRDGGTSWEWFSNGLPKVPVFDLVANGTTNSLVAFTHGRGAWKLGIDPNILWSDGFESGGIQWSGRTP